VRKARLQAVTPERFTTRARKLREQGLTLPEVLVASLLLLIIAVSVLPLFSQAMVNNQAGADSTSVANYARSRIEEFYQLQFNADLLTITAGSERVIQDYYSFADEEWKDGAEPADDSDPALWTRTTTIRQYGNTSITDGVVTADEALPTGTDPGAIHFKEIEVFVQGGRGGGPLGPAKRMTIRALKTM
jgi:prepilin-type N-terminal cleavage/methylation domain-containing protein